LRTSSALQWNGLLFGLVMMACGPPIGACSAAITPNVYGRNYDYRPRYYGAQFALLQVRGSYAKIGSTRQLTGRLDGMNEHGLIIGLHQVKKSPRFPGLSADLIVRIILDQCATTAEAVARLRRLPHAMQYNYSLLDAFCDASVVEAGAGAVAVRTGAWLACTNHFQSAVLRPLNDRRFVARSQYRLPPLEAWASDGLSAEQMFTALNRSTSPAFFHSYLRGAGTLPATRAFMDNAVCNWSDAVRWAIFAVVLRHEVRAAGWSRLNHPAGAGLLHRAAGGTIPA
jgi:predicted choloylglycine hydrolase